MIYICIPSHNEEQTVGVVLWKIRQVMAELARDYQLLVADDGSTDRTAEVLEPYTRVLPLTVLRTGQRRGYAAALEMLLREAADRSKYPRRDAVIVLQADFTEDPEHIAALLKRLESGADIVASNAEAVPGRVPLLHRVSRALAARMVGRLTWPEEVRDPLNGYTAYRVFTVQRAIDAREGQRLLTCEGAAANAQLLQGAAPHARRIDAVEYLPRLERLQRPSRFRPLAALKRVRVLTTGAGAAPLAVDALGAVEVVGGVSRRISTAGAAAGAERPRRNGRRRDASGGEPAEKRTTRRRGGRGRSGKRPAASNGSAAATGGGTAPAGTGPAEPAGEPKERRPPRRRPEKTPAAAAAAKSEDGAAAQGAQEGPKKPRRRGRRGGRGRRRKPPTDAPPQEQGPGEAVPAQEDRS